MAGGMNPGIVFNLQRSVLSENDVWVCTCHFFKKIRLTPIPLKKVFFCHYKFCNSEALFEGSSL